MRIFNSTLVALMFVSNTAAQDDSNPFGAGDNSAQSKSISSHPDGDTPLARMTALVHTESLPKCDKIVVYALTSPKPFDDAPKDPIPPNKAFPIRPYDAQARIIGTATLSGRDVDSICETWRSMSFDKWASAFCHYPVYGLRFYRDDKLLFETSICWECSNFFIPDVSDAEPGDFGPDTDFQWYGFKKNKISDKLLEDLRQHLKHPALDREE